MEEGRLKSKRLSYTAKFKREVIRCAEENGNRKAAAIFGADESNVRLWRKRKAAISGSEDDIVWEDDVEDKDDSDWVDSTDNDSVMSDDGESDE
jgi:hypothetical protein